MRSRAAINPIAPATRLLVIAPNWIGDALMAQPLLARLRAQRPQARIDVLAPPWVAPVLRRMAQVDEVIESDLRHGELQLGERLRLARQLRARGYAESFVLPNSLKSALVPFLAGIPVRRGYVGEQRHLLVNRPLPNRRPSLPMAAHYAALADAPGAAPQDVPAPVLQADPVRARATADRFGLPPRYAVFCPGAEFGAAKRWPHYAPLAQRVDLPVVLLGSKNDRESTAGIPGIDLAGRTSLDEAIDLIAAAAFAVTNDSGLMHVAAALGRPQVALFGSSSPEHTPPLSPAARVVWLKPECSPCYARACPLGHFRCLNDLKVERVLQEIAQLRL